MRAPARPNRRIQFVGDSITCGYVKREYRRRVSGEKSNDRERVEGKTNAIAIVGMATLALQAALVIPLALKMLISILSSPSPSPLSLLSSYPPSPPVLFLLSLFFL